MKVKGDYNDGGCLSSHLELLVRSQLELGESGSLLMPIDPASWEDTFQEGGELGATPAEDTPGFTLVVASAAIAMAAFINQRRSEVEKSELKSVNLSIEASKFHVMLILQ